MDGYGLDGLRACQKACQCSTHVPLHAIQVVIRLLPVPFLFDCVIGRLDAGPRNYVARTVCAVSARTPVVRTVRGGNRGRPAAGPSEVDMTSAAREMLEHHQGLVRSLLAAVEAGADPDDAARDHHLLHLFPDVLAELDPDALPVLGADDRALVARAVLEEMDWQLGDALDELAAGADVDAAAVQAGLDVLMVELAAALPGTVERYRRVSDRAESWLEAHPEVVEVLLDEAVDAQLPPEEMLVALLRWMGALGPDERRDLTMRFADDPVHAVREVLALAVLAHQLDHFDGTGL